MTTSFVANAADFVDTAEGQAILRQLAEHGLGIFVPHMHDISGGFAELPPGLVQIENNLQVSFVQETDPQLVEAITVGWRWDAQTQGVLRCVKCFLGHHP